MEISPNQELLVQAVTELAEAPGAIQQRLNRAFMNSLSRVQPGDLTPELAARMEAITARMGATPITRVMMTDDESRALAKEIVAVAFEAFVTGPGH